MRSLRIIVVQKLYKPLRDGSPNADPRIIEAVDSHFESVKPLLDEVPVNVIKMTAQI